mgnify:CR=1 FL=1
MENLLLLFALSIFSPFADVSYNYCQRGAITAAKAVTMKSTVNAGFVAI